MLFTRLSNEEDQVIDEAAVAAEPITPEEVVEEQVEAEEVAAIVEETAGDVEALTQAEEATTEVEEQVEVAEEKLEKPEEVTVVDALVSQEQLRATAKMLGATPESIFGAKISQESAESNPATALQLSVEGAKEFLLKIAEEVKAIFQRIVANIKKLYVKAVVMLNRTEKTAIKLRDAVSKRGDAAADAAFTDGEVATIANRLGAVIVGTGAKELGANPDSVLGGYIESLKSPTTVKNTIGAIKTAAGFATAAVAGDEAKAQESYGKLVDAMKAIDPSGSAGFLNDVEKNLDKGGFGKSALSNPKVIAVIGTRVQCVGMMGVEGKPETAKFAAGTIALSADAVKAIKVAVPAKASVLKLLDGVIGASKASKTFSDAAIAEVDAADKLIGSIASEVKKQKEVSSAGKLAVTRFINATRVATANVALNSILAQVNGAKAVLTYCTLAAKKYPAA